jgi:hypothetical protein
MVVIVFAVAVTVAVIARLTTYVRDDRPSSPPRSHFHEVDRYPFHAH